MAVKFRMILSMLTLFATSAAVAAFGRERIRRTADYPGNVRDAYRYKESAEEANEFGRTLKPATRMPPWPKGEDPILDAWDCSNPDEIDNISYDQSDNCHAEKPITETRNTTFLLLQETGKRRHNGIRCKILETRQVQHCGMFDHMTHLNGKTFFNKMMAVPAQICNQMATRGLLLGYDGNSYQVARRGFTTLNYEWKGNSYATAAGEVKCTGGKILLENTVISNAVIHVEQQIWIEEDEFIWTKGLLHSTLQDAKLPCHVDDLECETGQGTFTWIVKDEDECTVQRTRQFVAQEVSNGEATAVMSIDKSMIALQKKDSVVNKCGVSLHETNVPGMFLEEGVGKRKWKDIHPSSMSTTMYTNAKDNWLLQFTMGEMEKRFSELLKRECAKSAKLDQFRVEARRAESGPRTWPFDADMPGKFAVTAGDSVYTYECKSVQVVPRVTKRCFNELPVYLTAPGGLPRPMFLQSQTRLLLTEGVEIPCTKTFTPKYKTKTGRWISGPPLLHYTKPPKVQG